MEYYRLKTEQTEIEIRGPGNLFRRFDGAAILTDGLLAHIVSAGTGVMTFSPWRDPRGQYVKVGQLLADGDQVALRLLHDLRKVRQRLRHARTRRGLGRGLAPFSLGAREVREL